MYQREIENYQKLKESISLLNKSIDMKNKEITRLEIQLREADYNKKDIKMENETLK